MGWLHIARRPGDSNVIGWVTSNIAWEILFGLAYVLARPTWRRARPIAQRLRLATFVALAVLTSRTLPLKPPRGRRRRGGRHHKRFGLAMELSDEALLAERYPPYVPASRSTPQ
jgi:hypothetical protein